ncbi:MAG TPA: hypothetical protein VLT51_12760 [Anaerolineales bacterium]|nr:hypothetical protein [Anaerolineales bacterium]
MNPGVTPQPAAIFQVEIQDGQIIRVVDLSTHKTPEPYFWSYAKEFVLVDELFQEIDMLFITPEPSIDEYISMTYPEIIDLMAAHGIPIKSWVNPCVYPLPTIHYHSAVRGQDLFFLGFTAFIFRIHHSRFAAVVTQKLPTACAIFAVFDHIGAITFWTTKCNFVYNHAAFMQSFRKNHHRKSQLMTVPNIAFKAD